MGGADWSLQSSFAGLNSSTYYAIVSPLLPLNGLGEPFVGLTGMAWPNLYNPGTPKLEA